MIDNRWKTYAEIADNYSVSTKTLERLSAKEAIITKGTGRGKLILEESYQNYLKNKPKTKRRTDKEITKPQAEPIHSKEDLRVYRELGIVASPTNAASRDSVPVTATIPEQPTLSTDPLTKARQISGISSDDLSFKQGLIYNCSGMPSSGLKGQPAVKTQWEHPKP